MLRWVNRAVLAAGALSLVACQSPTTASSTDTVTMTFSPDPVSANPSSGRFYTIKNANKPDQVIELQYATSFAVTLKNTSKVGATIAALTVKVQQASGGIVVVPTTGDVEYFDYDPASESNKVPANDGTETTQFTVYYTLPNKGKEAIVTISCSLTADDSSGSFSSQGTVRVLP